MRRWMGIVGIVVVLVVAAWAWPLIGAVQLAQAARSGVATDVVDRVDLPALRRSLARQIASTYLSLSGKTQKMSGFGQSLAGAAITTVADPYLAELLTPENITSLLSTGRINRVTVGGRPIAMTGALPGLPNSLNVDLFSIVTGSYYDGLADFVIPVQGAPGPDDDYGVHMRRDGLTWKLGGLDLPAAMVADIARSIMAGEKPTLP